MRRKVAPAEGGRFPEGFPDRLRVCWVEDWIDGSDWARISEAVRGTPGDVELAAAVRARSRWMQARLAWCVEAGVDPAQLPPARSPRWRSTP